MERSVNNADWKRQAKRFALNGRIHRHGGVLKAEIRSFPATIRAAALGLLLAGLAASLPGFTTTASAQGVSLSDEIISDPNTGAAILGFDPVAFFIAREAVIGTAEFQLMHAGKAWYFASAANLAAFQARPELYMPAFGGYDPVAMAAGFAVAGSPEIFALDKDRIYLFRRPENRDTFLKDPEIANLAGRNWPQVRRDMVP